MSRLGCDEEVTGPAVFMEKEEGCEPAALSWLHRWWLVGVWTSWCPQLWRKAQTGQAWPVCETLRTGLRLKNMSLLITIIKKITGGLMQTLISKLKMMVVGRSHEFVFSRCFWAVCRPLNEVPEEARADMFQIPNKKGGISRLYKSKTDFVKFSCL